MAITPLRYPGGKGKLAPYVRKLLSDNNLLDAHYVEPFCGGAGLALTLLSELTVSHLHLNDLDRGVYAFWECAVNRTDELCSLIEATPCDIDVWHTQKGVWRTKPTADLLELAFATFFLNRTNRSGILEAGVIGGLQQTGKWKLDARYNTRDLVERIRSIGRQRSRISVTNLEALPFLRMLQPLLPQKSLVYLDPPYVEKGPGLYLNSYVNSDHQALAGYVLTELNVPWMVTYDDHEVVRAAYSEATSAKLNLHYSAYSNGRRGNELVFFSDSLKPPEMAEVTGKYRKPWGDGDGADARISL